MNDPGNSSWITSNVDRVLTKVLRSLWGEDAPLVISYGRNCAELWALDSPRLQEQLAGTVKNGLVLVWDGCAFSSPVAGRISMTEYLTPLTWGLCALQSLPELRLAVLDLDAGSHAHGKFYRVLQSIDPSSVPLRLINAPYRGVADILRFLQKDISQVDSRTVMNVLSHQLRMMLTERGKDGDRHALANIVGPLILMGEDKSLITRGPQQSLVTLFKSVGLIAPRNAQHRGNFESPTKTAHATPAPKGREHRILLVDDQWEEGWDRWVSKMLAERSNYRLEKTASPEPLVSAIEAALSREPSALDMRFSMSLPSFRRDTVQSGSNDSSLTHEEETILLLDLRLFSLRPVATEAEFVFDRLLPMCRRFPVRGMDARQGIGFSENEIKTVEAWCITPARETDDYLLVLSLLPRLLALVDFSLPIVLFSSTGQRRIIELLKPHMNILTHFEKPRFTGMETEELVTKTEQSFRDALAAAEQLLVARRQCRLITTKSGLIPGSSPLSVSPKQSTRYVELFLDESDWMHRNATHFSLGGCFTVFDASGLREARAKANRFDDWLVQCGVRYFDSRGVGTAPSAGGLLQKGTNLLPYLRDYKNHADAPNEMGVVRLRIEKGKPGTRTGALANPESADNRYFLALKALLELFLCESVPALAGAGTPEDVVVSILPAARVVDIDPAYQDKAKTNFGLKWVGYKNLFFSLDRSQVYPLVADILDSHHIQRRTARLLGVQLPYDDSPGVPLPEFFICSQCDKSIEVKKTVADVRRELRCDCREAAFRPDYRALHYVADELLTQFPDGTKARHYDSLFRDVEAPGEFDEVLDEHLAATLTASRCLDAGDLVGALASFESPSPIGKKPRASTWLQRRLLRMMPSMTGEEFLRLANRLYADPTHQRGVLT